MADDPKHPMNIKFTTDRKGTPVPQEITFIVDSLKEGIVMAAESIIRDARDHMLKEHVKSEHDKELVDEACATIHGNLIGAIKSLQVMKTGDRSGDAKS